MAGSLDTLDDFKAIFETSLQSILPHFGLTESKDEQKKALFYLLSGKDVLSIFLRALAKV